MSDKSYPLIVCGRYIGECKGGWDMSAEMEIIYYDVDFVPQYAGPRDSVITVAFERGTIETYDDGGLLKSKMDLFVALAACEKREK